MSHEIERSDNLYLHKHAAWHGLGTIYEDALSPRDALLAAGLDTNVERWQLVAQKLDEDGSLIKQLDIDTHVANIRSDNHDLLGVVSSSYVPIQNEEMAEFCEALLDESEGTIEVESAGSIRGGKRVWFLLKGEQFAVRGKDEIFPYILVSNGHDGSSMFRVTPTTIRVVCSNTMHMVIPRTETGELLTSAFGIKHTKNVMSRVEEARQALKTYNQRLEENKMLSETLAKKEITSENMQAFFYELYQEDFGDIPINPQNGWEEGRKKRAQSAWHSFTQRFDDERSVAGTTVWNALNAYTGLVQHDSKARGKDDADRFEKRVNSNLFGLNQDRTQKALQKAYKLIL